MKYKFKLSSLDCAGCALEIEKKLNENDEIDYASVNFSKLMITVTTKAKNPLPYFLALPFLRYQKLIF